MRYAEQDARALLHPRRRDWISSILSVRPVCAVPPVVVVFLVEVVPDGVEAQWVWVFAGDVPVEYVPRLPGLAETLDDAVSVYMRMMRDWARVVSAGQPLGDFLVHIDQQPIRSAAARVSAQLDVLESILEQVKEGSIQEHPGQAEGRERPTSVEDEGVSLNRGEHEPN
jgi:hypothetical protein